MASPQKENGYVTIANELAERFSLAGMNGSEHRILWVIIRRTYGFNKKQDYISLTQFQKYTGMGRNQVVDTIKSLVGKRVLLKENSIYGLNKDYESWVVGKRVLGGQKPPTIGGKHPPKVGGKSPHTKDRKTYIQKTYSKKGGKPPSGEEDKKFNPLGAEILKAFESVDVKNKLYYGNTTQRNACDFLLNEYGLEEVLKRVSVLNRTNRIQYFPNITTPVQLRDKWVDLQNAVERKRQENKPKRELV